MNPIKFTVSTSWYEAMEDFPQSVKVEVYDAIFHYAATGIAPEMSTTAKCVFAFIKTDLDAERKARQEVSDCMREIGRKGSRPKRKQAATQMSIPQTD